MRKLLAGCAVVALATTAVHAQETTSSIRGTVTAAGGPVAGAAVTVTHVPSGTRSTVTTDGAGAYVASGLRPGGPYTVAASAGGYAPVQVTDVQINVEQAFELPLRLEAQGQEIVVTASRVKGARTVGEGPLTVLNADQISKIASVNRDIRDLMRRDPFATLDTSSQPNRSVSFAGQNPRFNRFTIDGVPITDSFGLNPDALPSRRGPVPLDSIGTFTTSVAPYDIREGFFQGGVVNATLKSGTNAFHGTGFYTYNSDKLNGDRTRDYITLPNGRVAIPTSKSQDYGATISGPIVKDRLFFMVSAERVRANLPLPNGTVDDNAGVPVIGLTSATLAQITQIAQARYGVDTGGIARNNNDHDDRIVGRIDANITDSQRLALTGIYTKDSILTLGTTSNQSLATASDDYIKPDRVIAGVAQLNSDWGGGFSTETRLLYKDYKSGQTPYLANTAQATICTDRGVNGSPTLVNGTTGVTACSPNVPTVVVGPQGSSQANVLRIKTYDGSETARYTAGNHHLKALFEYQLVKNYDLFINPALGSYYFDTIDAFQQGTAQTFTYQNATTLNLNDGAAIFNYQTYTWGGQDEWKINDQLTVSYGARYDLFGGHSRPLLNRNFVTREGFTNQYFVDGKGLLQPRVGFNYSPTRRISVHGGGGIFGGGTPDVYIANSFSASGVQPATLSSLVPTAANPNPGIFNNVSLTQVPPAAQALIQNATNSANGSVSAIDRNFKIPSQWRATLSGSYDADLGRFGDHWIIGGDVLFSKVRNAIFIRDGRDRPVTGINALTPDGRQRYYDVALGPGVPGGATPVTGDPNGDYILSDTDKGRSWVGVAHIAKNWDFGLGINGSFTYQNVKDQQALTSSIASSNYNNGAYYDPNGGAYGHSNDEVKYSFKYDVSFDHAFFRDYRTRFDLFGETRIGSPYSYTFQDSSSSGQNRSSVFGTVGSNSHYLFYVPTGPNDPKAVYADAATQNAIENLINSTGLSKYRGKVAPRNAFYSKWFTRLDLHAEQEIPTFVGHSRITVFADVENFTNLLNRNWGQQLRANFPYNKTVAQVACVAANGNSCAQYRYSQPTSAQILADQLITTPSLYTIRVGARFSF